MSMKSQPSREKLSHTLTPAFLGAVILCGMLMTACFGPSAASSSDGSGGPRVGGDDRYSVLLDGAAAPYSNGQPVVVANDLTAEVTIVPREGRWVRLTTIRLYRKETPEATVAEAAIAARVTMRDMPNVDFHEEVTNLGNGAYEIPLRFSMPGVWRLTLHILDGADDGTVQFDLDLPDVPR